MAGSVPRNRDVDESADRCAGGRLARLFYSFMYRHGRPRWDSSDAHPGIKELLADRQPGRALDLGCGTGSDAIFMAEHGWEVVGVDFAPEAIEAAKRRAAEAGCSARFVVGDVTRLHEAGIEAPFDLILDTGCYHSVPVARRRAYAAEVAAVAGPQADFYLAGFTDAPAIWHVLGASGVDGGDVRLHFGTLFDVVGQGAAGESGRMSSFVRYHLVRAGQVGD